MIDTLEAPVSLKQFHTLEQDALISLKSSANHAFVTGAGGFLGKAICQRLLSAGLKVTGFARGDYPELTALGVTMVRGDIADKTAVLNAMKGCDLVFHVASKAGVWGSKQSYFSPNVDGAANIISACQQLKISKLIYTSTPSVTFAGVDESGIDENAPYADNYLNHYGESKAIAEQMVLEANSQALKTLALRPHLIWGPEDPHLVPRVIERAKAGRLKLVGKEDKLVDTIYVGNAAYAHILAAVNLCSEDASAAGKAYFLSNDEPITMAAMLNKILACADLPEVTKRVPAGLAYAVGVVLESVYGILGKTDEPMMTRFVAKQLSTSHYFDISAAKTDFGYSPIISIDQGMVKLRQYLNS
ncbi:NAD-dependent epimerase/dehydratase family protein [Shewanella eurypsychrophilus]|uniref:NAD-dependent epimerase/dehydratase family protein n=1 Tax=Shewanella eurypsychrophilus TaxID=2593656 RepID=A0ABX6V3T7_9GAMM|nr:MULTISPECIES: 2-alkyl-3-oxoalkanoate reductase [Shewanella]QFU21970.1 NAD-dependent epimerase/dehydratase family protein [Shewanella sp. YLB-09]QPG57259.1 NAD-dependent epimerase/dehydratase family protein [Shewanella eurypsychrophilus]